MDLSFIPLFAVVVLLLFPLAVALFQWLWNTTMPEVFGLKIITFWQAFRLLLITQFLFSGGFSTGTS